VKFSFKYISADVQIDDPAEMETKDGKCDCQWEQPEDKSINCSHGIVVISSVTVEKSVFPLQL